MKCNVNATIAAVALLSLIIPSCGGDVAPGIACSEGTTAVEGECIPVGNLRCGEGTYEADGECKSFDPADGQAPTTTLEPGATRFREGVVDVWLKTEPDARIFYTTNGSAPDASSRSEPESILIAGIDVAQGPVQLRFYAVDKAGNREASRSVTLTQDLEAPGTVLGFQAVREPDGTVSLSWTNPSDSDFLGVVILRAGKWTSLVDGEVPASEDVLYVGAATSFSDSSSIQGNVQYVAIAFDDLKNFAPRVGSNTYELPVLVGSSGWTFRSDGSAVAGSTATGVTIDVSASGISDFRVSVTNHTTQTFHAPKVVFSNVVDGSWGDGSIGGESYVRVGTLGHSLVPGATLSGTFTPVYTGVASAQGGFSASADITFRGDSLIAIGVEQDDSSPLLFVDEGTFSELGWVNADSYSPVTSASGRLGMQGVVSRPGDRFLWAGNRSKGVVRKIDSATWSTVAVAEIGGDQNLVGHPMWGPSGLLWVPLSTSGPRRISSRRMGDDIGTFLVAIDADTMQEVRRVEVSALGQLRDTLFLPYQNKVVALNFVSGELYLVDLNPGASAVITTPGIVPRGRTITISADQSKAVVAGETGRLVSILDLSSHNIEVVSLDLNDVVVSSALAGDGRVWLSSGPRVALLDLTDNSSVTSADFSGDRLVAHNGLIYASGGSRLEEHDSTQTLLRSVSTISRARVGGKIDWIE